MKTVDPLQEASVSLPEPNIWKETYQIRSYEVDCHRRLSILSIFHFIQVYSYKLYTVDGYL